MMSQKFLPLLSRIADFTKTFQPITANYCRLAATSGSTEQLATDFEQLSDGQLSAIIQAYNHALPTFYKKNDIVTKVPDKALTKLFITRNYVCR